MNYFELFCNYQGMPAKVALQPAKEPLWHPAKIPDSFVLVVDVFVNDIGKNMVFSHLDDFKVLH